MAKEDIIKLLEHEKAICEKLKKEYSDEWLDAVVKGDKAKSECLSDVGRIASGQIMAYENAIEIIKRELN